MQSVSEQRRLVEAYGERRRAASVIAACAAGLLLIVGVVVFGCVVPAEERPDRQRLEHRARPAEAHRKQVFDERRSRHEGHGESRDLAERGPAERTPPSMSRKERGL